MKKKNKGHRYENEYDYLWNLIISYFIYEDPQAILSQLSSLYEQEFDFNLDTENNLLDIWSNKDFIKINALAKRLVLHRALQINDHIFLIALLVKKQIIDIEYAADLIDSNQGDIISNLPDSIRNVLDVAAYVQEDKKESIMDASDDKLLEDALFKVLE